MNRIIFAEYKVFQRQTLYEMQMRFDDDFVVLVKWNSFFASQTNPCTWFDFLSLRTNASPKKTALETNNATGKGGEEDKWSSNRAQGLKETFSLEYKHDFGLMEFFYPFFLTVSDFFSVQLWMHSISLTFEWNRNANTEPWRLWRLGGFVTKGWSGMDSCFWMTGHKMDIERILVTYGAHVWHEIRKKSTVSSCRAGVIMKSSRNSSDV